MFLQMGILSVFMITEPTEKEDEELQELASKEHEEVSKEIEEKMEDDISKEHQSIFSLTPLEALKTKEFYKVTYNCY